MTKNTLLEQKRNSESKHQDLLKRRPIHKGQQNSDDNETQKYDLDNNSPIKPQKLYPTLDDEDEEDATDEADAVNKEYEQNKSNYKPFYGSYLASYKYVLGLLIVLVLFCSYFSYAPKPAAELSIQEKLKNLQDTFQDQNYFTFRILELALNKVVNVTEESSAPAIFTVTVNKNAIYKSHEFSHYLANIIAPQNIVLVNESISWHNNPDDIKFEIDNKIKSKAKEKSLFVVIIDNLHNIPLKTAMLFHHYCDHEVAPFKHGVFLFIVPLNEILPKDVSNKNVDKAAFKHLKSIWNKASSDEIDSLITRITVNVINIR